MAGSGRVSPPLRFRGRRVCLSLGPRESSPRTARAMGQLLPRGKHAIVVLWGVVSRAGEISRGRWPLSVLASEGERRCSPVPHPPFFWRGQLTRAGRCGSESRLVHIDTHSTVHRMEHVFLLFPSGSSERSPDEVLPLPLRGEEKCLPSGFKAVCIGRRLQVTNLSVRSFSSKLHRRGAKPNPALRTSWWLGTSAVSAAPVRNPSRGVHLSTHASGRVVISGTCCAAPRLSSPSRGSASKFFFHLHLIHHGQG